MNKMKQLFSITIIFLTLIAHTFGQTDDMNNCYELYSDTLMGQVLYGYKYKGKIQIQAKYLSTYSDNLCNMAIVYDRGKAWVGIDKNDSIILTPFIYDNCPDYVEEGLFRFVENKKLGFATLEGQKVISAQFDFVSPFKNGYATYYIGGERIYENGKTEKQIMTESGYAGLIDLHWTWGGNIIETGYINKHGQRFKEKEEEIELEMKAKQFVHYLIQLIEQKDNDQIKENIAEKVYCYLCFNSMPKDLPYISKDTFVYKYLDRIFDQELIEHLKRNESTFFIEPPDNEYSGHYNVLFTIYRNNELGDAYEGVQFGFWLTIENGQFKLLGVETIP